MEIHLHGETDENSFSSIIFIVFKRVTKNRCHCRKRSLKDIGRHSKSELCSIVRTINRNSSRGND